MAVGSNDSQLILRAPNCACVLRESTLNKWIESWQANQSDRSLPIPDTIKNWNSLDTLLLIICYLKLLDLVVYENQKKKKLKVVLIQRGCVVSVTLTLSLNFSRFSCPCYLWSHVSGCNKQLNKWTQQWSFCPGSFCLNQVLLIQYVYSSFGNKTINSSFFYWSSTGTAQLVEMEHTL